MSLLGRTQFSQGKVKLASEAKPLGVLFSGRVLQSELGASLNPGMTRTWFSELVSASPKPRPTTGGSG